MFYYSDYCPFFLTDEKTCEKWSKCLEWFFSFNYRIGLLRTFFFVSENKLFESEKLCFDCSCGSLHEFELLLLEICGCLCNQ